MPTAILSPHLDDAVLSAWSALRDADDALVVNVFDGVPQQGTLSRWDRMTGALDSSDRMRERLEEDRRALARVNRPAVSLGFLEAQYRTGEPAGELDAALARATSGAHELWAPAGIGGHADHVAVRDWALGSAARGGPRVRLYAELPYCVRHGWPGWVTGADASPYLSQELGWERFMPDPNGLRLTPTAHALDQDEVRLKLQALDEYRTQIVALDCGPIGLLRTPAVIGYEVSWLLA